MADDTPHQVLFLTLELLHSGDLPELAVGGAWWVAETVLMRGSAPLGHVALEADICGLATAHLRAIGRAADWMVRACSPVQARRAWGAATSCTDAVTTCICTVGKCPS